MEGWSRRSAGPAGEVRAGHRVAARLGAWDIAPSGVWGEVDPEGAWSLVAQTSERNAFWLAHGGRLDLVLTDLAGRRLRFGGIAIVPSEKFCARGQGAPEVL